MTSVAQLSAVAAQSKAASDFHGLALAKLTMKDAESRARIMADPAYSDRVKNILRSAVAVGSTTDSTFGDPLVEYDGVVRAFIESLTAGSVFDRLLTGGMVRVPLQQRLAATTAVLTANDLSEGTIKPVSRLSLSGAGVDPRKAVGLIITNDEVAKLAGPAAMAFLGRELRRAVARATNAAFLPALATGAGTTIASTDHPLEDLRALLGALDLGETSRLLWVLPTDQTKRLCTVPTTSGAAAFPDMGPLGGSISGVPVMASDEVTAGEGLLIDATGLAGETGTVNLDQIRHGDIQLDDAPDSPESASTVLQNLWQRGQRVLRAERFYGFEIGNSGAVARLTGVNYSAPDSPI